MKKIIVLLPFLLFRIISNSQSSLVVNNKLIESNSINDIVTRYLSNQKIANVLKIKETKKNLKRNKEDLN